MLMLIKYADKRTMSWAVCSERKGSVQNPCQYGGVASYLPSNRKTNRPGTTSSSDAIRPVDRPSLPAADIALARKHGRKHGRHCLMAIAVVIHHWGIWGTWPVDQLATIPQSHWLCARVQWIGPFRALRRRSLGGQSNSADKRRAWAGKGASRTSERKALPFSSY